MQLLEIFHAFTTVKNLYVRRKFAEIIFAPILQEHVGETSDRCVTRPGESLFR